ncbi:MULTISPECIES: TetR/AcrR family transcriptional regulator [unclassified Rhizobium]|uniref:TetR/AcrR family transcriptional regulator n=1 Tax=unclassified Rhizobium TaxID=2613769 RepID=UPI001AD9C4A0|nr:MULTISPECIES: TetR/AcrR family transcriptional regulator [unclassified Rhizobium]MBO9126783.1 TetR/AcrR family transcriptional regulator [Rhizobium sp. 16-488-2b]MBO9177230.1 TetR/AcrR family transcriptional regulator [Rhizobium sp. 16-488-2a]
MGRTRKISEDDILDAAERVVVRLGAAGLSIDAVAQEAGVSKARVVYDHKSKSGLLEALVDRKFKADIAHVEECVQAAKDTPHPELFGRIASAESTIDDTDRAVAMAVSASMASGDKLQETMREWCDLDLRKMAEGARPKAALMAYLALTGFFCTELFTFHTWPEVERREILDGIRSIYLSYADKT